MRARFRSLLPLLPLILLLVPAGARVARAEDQSPAVEPRQMAVAVDAFARELYGRVSGGDGNLFFSPYSVHAAMLLAREGARGETRAQMDAALHVKDLEAGAGYEALVAALRAPQVRDFESRERRTVPAYELEIANALWGQEAYPFEQRFIERLAGVYGAPLARVDFTKSAEARQAINDWVAKATRDKIEDIVPDGMPPPATRLALANAIYMKAQWQDAFREGNTKPGDFTGPDGKTSKAQLMHRRGGYRYAEIDGVQVLEIPYRGGHLAMHVYLPKDHTGLKDVETRLREGRLDGARTAGRQVDVKLPRFEFTTSLDLTAILSRMGMPLAFHPSKADFSGMTKAEKLHVGVVLHKAFVGVDEKGTEAAAATVVMMKAGSAPPSDEPVAFHADHPFVFEIRHRATNTVLFAGRVTRP